MIFYSTFERISFTVFFIPTVSIGQVSHLIETIRRFVRETSHFATVFHIQTLRQAYRMFCNYDLRTNDFCFFVCTIYIYIITYRIYFIQFTHHCRASTCCDGKPCLLIMHVHSIIPEKTRRRISFISRVVPSTQLPFSLFFSCKHYCDNVTVLRCLLKSMSNTLYENLLRKCKNKLFPKIDRIAVVSFLARLVFHEHTFPSVKFFHTSRYVSLLKRSIAFREIKS